MYYVGLVGILFEYFNNTKSNQKWTKILFQCRINQTKPQIEFVGSLTWFASSA